jgi:hypothetical protein
MEFKKFRAMADQMKADRKAGPNTKSPSDITPAKKELSTPIKNDDSEIGLDTRTPDPEKKNGIARKVDGGKKRVASGVLAGRAPKKGTPTKSKIKCETEDDSEYMLGSGSGLMIRSGEVSDTKVKEEYGDNDKFTSLYGAPRPSF